MAGLQVPKGMRRKGETCILAKEGIQTINHHQQEKKRGGAKLLTPTKKNEELGGGSWKDAA